MQRIAVFSAGLCCALLLAGCGAPSGAASAAQLPRERRKQRPPPLRLRPRRSLLPMRPPRCLTRLPPITPATWSK